METDDNHGHLEMYRQSNNIAFETEVFDFSLFFSFKQVFLHVKPVTFFFYLLHNYGTITLFDSVLYQVSIFLTFNKLSNYRSLLSATCFIYKYYTTNFFRSEPLITIHSSYSPYTNTDSIISILKINIPLKMNQKTFC